VEYRRPGGVVPFKKNKKICLGLKVERIDNFYKKNYFFMFQYFFFFKNVSIY